MKNLVIENKFGQVVRYIHSDSKDFYIIHRLDTQRIENVSELETLKENKVPFTIIKEVQTDKIGLKGIEIARGTFLKALPDIQEISLNIRPLEETDDNLKKAFKYVAIVNVIFLIFAFSLSYFFKEEEPVEMQVVRIEPRPQQKPVVEPMKDKRNFQKDFKVAKREIKKPTIKPSKSLRPSPHKVKKMVAINTIGAVGILGALGSGTKGGLKVDAIQTSRGPGLGGNAGSGGMQSSFYGRGLVGATLGAGNKINGAGGIGTRGKGGGKEGYGSLSLVGSSGAYFQPVEEDAVVEGGLDRDEIAAVIQRHLGQIRFCYEQGLQTRPELNGRVAVKFVISGSGFVSIANVANTSLKSKAVEGCIVQRLKSWKFPEPRGGVNVRVTYPFVLKRLSQS